MPRQVHTLSKPDLLSYALDGARTQLALNWERLTDGEIELFEKDIAEIQRRMKLVKIAEEVAKGER
jgi:hypothetical protein